MPTPLTPSLIASHERLYPRLAALLKQVERARGNLLVPEETARVSRELCREAAKLLGREGRGIAVPPPNKPLDHQGLAVMLGQAVAGLGAFEAAHSGWSPKSKCAVWVIDGPPRPVLRLMPPGSEGKPVQSKDPQAGQYRRELYKLIMGRYAAGYDAGYRDAKEGTAPRADYCERVWDGLMEKEAGVEEARRAGLRPPRVRASNPPRHLVPEGSVPSDPAERRRRM